MRAFPELDVYQKEAASADRTGHLVAVMRASDALHGISAQLGELSAMHAKRARLGQLPSPSEVLPTLGKLLWYTAALATVHSLSLGNVADMNLRAIGVQK